MLVCFAGEPAYMRAYNGKRSMIYLKRDETMTHQEMVDTIQRGLAREFVILAELTANPAPPFVIGIRKFGVGYRQHIYLLFTEPEFLSAPRDLKTNEIRVQQLVCAIHWPRLDLEKEYLLEGDMHVRMVVPDTTACRKKLEDLAQSNSDWPRYCLLLDSTAGTLIADLASEESFLLIRDNNSTEGKKTTCKEVHDDNARSI